MVEQGTGQPRRTVFWEGAGELQEAGVGFLFHFARNVLLKFQCIQNISQKRFDLAELADSDQKYLLCLF